MIVGSYQLAIAIGLLLAAVVDDATKDRNDSGSYRIPVGIQFVWALIIIIGLLILPETPRYLILSEKPDEAARSLARIRRLPCDHSAIREELEEIVERLSIEVSLGKSNYLELFKGNIGKRLLTGCLIQGLQQLSGKYSLILRVSFPYLIGLKLTNPIGINFIFYYGTQYFKNSGIKSPFLITMITSSVNVCFTIPGIYAVDKFGRRPLLLFGSVGSYLKISSKT